MPAGRRAWWARPPGAPWVGVPLGSLTSPRRDLGPQGSLVLLQKGHEHRSLVTGLRSHSWHLLLFCEERCQS